jgi:hypothetical protein
MSVAGKIEQRRFGSRIASAAERRIEEIRKIILKPATKEEKKLNHHGALDSFVPELVRLHGLASQVISGDTICQKLSDEDRDFLESVLESVGLPKHQVRAALAGTSNVSSQERVPRKTKGISAGVRRDFR